MPEPGFPVLKVGSRMVVPKEQFILWVQEHTGNDHGVPLQALCASIRRGVGNLPLPGPFWAVWRGIWKFAEDEGRSRIIPKYYISPQCGERLCRWYLHGRGSGFYPPSGGASRAFGLPQAAAKRLLRAEARTHLHGPLGRMTDAKP